LPNVHQATKGGMLNTKGPQLRAALTTTGHLKGPVGSRNQHLMTLWPTANMEWIKFLPALSLKLSSCIDFSNQLYIIGYCHLASSLRGCTIKRQRFAAAQQEAWLDAMQHM
jgi:hypothetical protein